MSVARATESLCPVCLRSLPARIEERGGDVFLKRRCPEHGEFSALIWRGQPTLSEWSRPKNPGGAGHAETKCDRGCPHDCGICEEHRQHSCTVLFEITQACNLRCPVCFAASGGASGKAGKESVAEEDGARLNGGHVTSAPTRDEPALEAFTPLETLLEQLAWVHSKAPEVVLQISGGEPTLHPKLASLVRHASRLFPAVQLNTNGLRLAQSKEFCKELAEAGLSWVFLQFDGTNDDIYRLMRGRELFDLKQKAVQNCREAGLAVVLVPTLARGVNDSDLGNILDYALKCAPAVRGIHIQPMAFMGRNDIQGASTERLTLPEVLAMLSAQSGGRILPGHASPPGCEHERCSFHCRYMLGHNKDLRPIRESACCSASAIAPGPASGFCSPEPQKLLPYFNELAGTELDRGGQNNKDDDGVGKAISTLIRSWGPPAGQAGESESQEEDALSRFIRQARQNTFSVTCMAFQDAMTVDLDRLRGCCVHVFAPPARLVPFCSYNLTALDGRPLHRGINQQAW